MRFQPEGFSPDQCGSPKWQKKNAFGRLLNLLKCADNSTNTNLIKHKKFKDKNNLCCGGFVGVVFAVVVFVVVVFVVVVFVVAVFVVVVFNMVVFIKVFNSLREKCSTSSKYRVTTNNHSIRAMLKRLFIWEGFRTCMLSQDLLREAGN